MHRWDGLLSWKLTCFLSCSLSASCSGTCEHIYRDSFTEPLHLRSAVTPVKCICLYRKQNIRLHPNDSTLLPKLYFFTDEGKCFPCGQKEEIHSFFFSFEPYTQTLLLLLKLISNEKHSFSFQIPEQSLIRGFCSLGKSLCKTYFAWLLRAAGMQHPQLGLISRPLAHQHNLSVEVDY